MASAAGTPVDDACVLKFKDLKSKRKYKYVTYKIDNDCIVVANEGAPNAGFDEFTEALPENDPRYAVFDFEWETKDGCKKSKIVFVTWVPDTAKIRNKMLYASSKDKFKRELDGIQVEIQGTDFSEVEEKVFLDKCSGH
ncbi:actin-depolymerizing factor [Chloropicon primus]|uniref:Actin-depolymerizing factor n=1 Tax=Chloropicon primus TaxID=1764295 RepID=A0A5B8MZ17_9CHLO|nr:actin-depolymerizing factor [Chloropicon primus]UPR04512.1 actin-depolymerizing factor [Chloropicon primus]|eukprot:QDZ25306.1 actin-depolymerizing factor [Chloropicon primus]